MKNKRPVDWTRFGPNGDPFQGKDISNPTWWDTENKKPEEIAGGIADCINMIMQAQPNRVAQAITSVKLYGNMSMMGPYGFSASRLSTGNSAGWVNERVTYNVCQSATDTVTAKLAKNKPKPLFLTSGGNYAQIRKAKKLNQAMDGIFYENNYHSLAVEVFRDSCIFGTGAIYVGASNGRCVYERVIPTEIYVDEIEAFYGDPRQLHRVKNVDRRVLAATYPDHAKAIAEVTPTSLENNGSTPTVADLVAVRYSWHLPSTDKADDGKFLTTIDGYVLDEQPWNHDFFPFAFLHWSKKLYGFWGQGLVEQIQNIQFEINKLLWVIQRSMHLAGSYKVLVENTSKIVKEHLNNDIGAIITYTNNKPEYITPPIVPQEIYQHLQTLKNSAFEQAAVSQLSAMAKKPEGLDSGKALREYNNIESDRFTTIGQQYEQLALDVAKLSIAVLGELTGGKKNYEIRVPGKKTVQTINWKEINLGEDDYIMKCYPVSSLPNSPEGRLQTIQEYMQAGMINPRQGRRLLDFPDLDAVENLANAEEDYLTQVFDKIVDDGVFTPPEPYDDLQMAREMALEYYAFGKNNELEEERLQLIRQFLDQLDQIQQLNAPPPPSIGTPQAVPEAPPQSNLLPNVPGNVPQVA